MVNLSHSRRWATLAALLLAVLSVSAETIPASKIVAEAKWKEEQLAPGVMVRQHHFTNLFAGAQFISVIEVDLAQTNARVRFAAAHQYGWTNVPLPQLAERANALAAINAGFFGKEPTANSGILKIDGELLPFTKREVDELHFVGGSAVGIDSAEKWHFTVRPERSWGDDWPEMRHAIAGGHALIINGELRPEISRDVYEFQREARHVNSRHPRTAIGVTTNNTALLVTADGRFPLDAIGLTMLETAQLMRALGCDNAINLDGGGSTTMWLRDKGIINHPSDNKKFDRDGARAIRTAVIVTVDEDASRGVSSFEEITWKAKRSSANPLIVPNMPGLTGRAGQNINGPSVIRVPSWVKNPLGRYYMYFAHHRDSYIRLAYSDSLEGPWTIHAPGTLRLEQTAARDHIASPDVLVDEERQEIRMYFHGVHPNDSKQVTWVATSSDGLNFKASPEILGWFYFRVFQHDGWHYAIAKKGNESGILYRSRDGLTGFEEGHDIIPNMRHVAVQKEGDHLHLFYSRIGDAPESILHSTMSLKGDWESWNTSEPTLVLAPEEDYEGGHLPTEPSLQGQARNPVRQLRDPAIIEENGRLYLFYSIAGEQGIALAELFRSKQ